METNFFIKSHGLGNDYIVMDAAKISFDLTTNAIMRICNIHYGIGSDGILLKVDSKKADFGLKIYNPDASEAEKSGNGLRIFCKFLYDYGFATTKIFTVETLGGIVTAQIIEEVNKKATLISVDMGKAIFETRKIPVDADSAEFIAQAITVGDKQYEVNCLSVGNPHCVVIKEDLNEEEIKTYGTLIENHKLFPNRINVQFAKAISRSEAEILIWERGAGWTLASGSSSCAAACALKKRGLVDGDITMNMRGGILKIEIDQDWNIRMTGPVREIGKGILTDEMIEDLEILMAE